MHIALTIWAVTAAWRWGDWKNFQHYHPTMIYMSTMNLLYYYFTSDYPLWRIQPDFGLPDALIMCLYTFLIFPCTVLLFLSNFPMKVYKQWAHIGKWVAIYLAVEWAGLLSERITYENGWHLGASFLFLLVMFPFLRLHHKKPVVAYILSIVIITLLLYLNAVPLYKGESL